MSGLPGTATSAAPSAIPITSARPLLAAGGQSAATAGISCSQTAGPALQGSHTQPCNPRASKPRDPLCISHCCSPPEQPPARMKRAGVCRGALQDKECQFRHVGFNRWRHPSHALQHPCNTNPWQGRAALGAFTGCPGGWKGSFSFLFSHSKV